MIATAATALNPYTGRETQHLNRLVESSRNWLQTHPALDGRTTAACVRNAARKSVLREMELILAELSSRLGL